MKSQINEIASKIYEFILSLTALEITLIAIIIVLAFAFLYVLKQWLILRYVFFTSSDWCADKITEICEDAIEKITDLSNQIYELKYGKEIDKAEALKFVSTSIINGNKDWFIQKEKFQNKIEKNGQPRLGLDDGWFSLGSRWCKV